MCKSDQIIIFLILSFPSRLKLILKNLLLLLLCLSCSFVDFTGLQRADVTIQPVMCIAFMLPVSVCSLICLISEDG